MSGEASGMPDTRRVAESELRPVLSVLRALRDGDFTARVEQEHSAALGIHTDIADTVNQLAARTEHLATELIRVRSDVVRRGRVDERLSASPGQGTWTDAVHAVNTLLETILGSRAEATRVLAAVADGDLSRRVDLHEGGSALRGELRRLGRTVNRMTDQLALFTSEVTRAALDEDGEGGRGQGGKHTGPVTPHTTVLGLSGSWRDAAEAVNRMVTDLRETTRAKEWLESNLTRLAALMQGRRDIREIAEPIMRELPPLVGAQFGAFFLAGRTEVGTAPGTEELSYVAGYGTAAYEPGARPRGGVDGHSLIAQVAREKRRLLLTDVPPSYLPIGSGLGEARPACVVILPVLYEDRLLGVLELASFSTFSDIHLAFFDQFVHTMGVALHTIRANTELSEKAALLAASSQYKTQFLANMSHELRTPLNSLLVLSQLLTDNEAGNLSPEEVRFAQTIHRSGTDLLLLINDVLDLAKIEAGRMEARPRRLTLRKLLTYVEDTFRPLAHDRGLGFAVTAADDAPLELHADERRLQQVLRNLLSNALKFTAQGSITLHAAPAVEPGTDGEPLIAFIVTDTGIGITTEQLPRIFEAFQQGDGSTHRTYGGTGLGLAISRELAELLGGWITVESTPGKGSSFTLCVPAFLPAAVPPPVAGAHTAAEPSGSPATREPGSVRTSPCPPLDSTASALPAQRSALPEDGFASSTLTAWQSGRAAEVLRGTRVLIADDDIRNVFALTHLLGRVGMSVRYAENGVEALAALEREPTVDLVLMDIMMPELDGYEAIRALRADSRFARLPVVALTAQAMPGDSEQSLSAGASAYVPKPVVIDQLLGTVLTLLDPHFSTRQQR
ncbi:ATP-binding protein [Streptomyces albidus (ex Kaewkla and Franco 2022)]|uniref:hybrid sensor histidine kinase/response regulator n=1 Tax=Streptomyces albidus (ex Kaewkla and Franco 2022) TaxID=722709 RepID=UPI0015EFAC28|nr:ATP-binding protein [Streptomyces albidus (ex Kaewkla and Franco 2022)]